MTFRSTARRRAALATGLCLAVTLSGCGFSDDSGGGKPGTVTMEYTNVSSLDPQRVSWGMWLDASALLEGLVVLNAKGDGVEPGVAEKWEPSADKRTYTFHLRDATWSDGKPVTAKDFEWSYQRLLTPSSAQAGTTQGAASYLPSLGLKGAQEFLTGALTDWSQVGVKATDDKTLVLTLAAPNTDFLIGLTHPSMLPLPRHVVEAKPQEWQKPESWVGNGPFTVKSWTVNSSMTLVPNEHYWDKGNVTLSQVDLNLTEDPKQAGVHFTSKDADIVSLPPADLPRFQEDDALAKQLVSIPDAFSNYLAVLHSQNPALEDVRVREALSLAMDREKIVKTCADCRPSYSLVPEKSVPGAREAAGVTEDVKRAKQLLADAGYPGGAGLPQVHILANQANPMLEAIVDNWQRNLGITAAVDVVETGVYVERRDQLQPADYIGFYSGSFAAPPTWRAWTATQWDPTAMQIFSISGADWPGYLTAKGNGTGLAYAAEHASPDATEFAEQVADGSAKPDEAAAEKLYREAARTRQDTYLVLPTTYVDQYYAVRSGISGVDMHVGYLLPFSFKGVSSELGTD
jgi:oligopeptide transport system substrate-binding protein